MDGDTGMDLLCVQVEIGANIDYFGIALLSPVLIFFLGVICYCRVRGGDATGRVQISGLEISRIFVNTFVKRFSYA